MFLFYSLFFIFGAIIGSFLNVVILRLGTGRGLGGRSGCASCSKRLEWFELLPVVSFLALRARCSGCRSKISWQYPLVELLTAVTFVLIAYTYFHIYAFVVASILIVIAVYDYKHMIIPDPLVYTLIGIGIVPYIFNFGYSGYYLDLLAGPMFFTFFASLWLISRGAWIGFGDAKLALALGLLLGFSAGLTAMLLSFWIGAVIGVIMIIISKIVSKRTKVTLRTEIPFGPFMILASGIVFFLHLDLLWVSGLFMF